jgi:hypothetical protein
MSMIRSSVVRNVVRCFVLTASQVKYWCHTTISVQYASSIYVTFALTEKYTKGAGIAMLFYAIVILRIAKLLVIVARRCNVLRDLLNSLALVVFVGISGAGRNALILNVLVVDLWE